MLIVGLALFVISFGRYTITQDELNQALAKKFELPISQDLSFSQGDETIDVSMQISMAELVLSSDQGGLIQVRLKSQITGRLSLFSRQFELTSQIIPRLETGIRLEQDRLYLVGPKLVGLEVAGSSFQDQMLRSVLPTIQTPLELAIKQHFDQQAVYLLEHSLLEKLVAVFASDISVKQEMIELSLF